MNATTAVTTIPCPACDGATFVLDPCRCPDGYDDGYDAEPAGECDTCGGTGSVSRACRACGRHGRLRAQVVLTVANLDTGAVASASVVPGMIPPSPAPGGGWQLSLVPLLHDLAAEAGVAPASLRDLSRPEGPSDPEATLSLYVSREWRPELPAAERFTLEAQALARPWRAPWLVYLGASAAPEPPRLDRLLDRLCRLADRLCLDLVLEARGDEHGYGLRWNIRYEVPGTEVATPTHHSYDDLLVAIEHTTAADALYGLDERSLDAPAHFLEVGRADGRTAPREPIDVDRLERRILRDCTESAGGQAIWRDGRWWHTGLRRGGTGVTHTGIDAGADRHEPGPVLHRPVAIYLRNWEPPRPSWLGEPMPPVRCPGCHGTGIDAYGLSCAACCGARIRWPGTVLTVTDLRGRVAHVNWHPDDDLGPATPVATHAGGPPVFQLPERFRLRSWARAFGVRPEELTHPDGDRPIGQDLRDGIVTLPPSATDPGREYVAAASRGRAGARLIVCAVGWDAPPLARLARLVIGLGLALHVTVANHRANAGDPRRIQGLWWEVSAVDPAAPIRPADPPLRQSLPEAINHCLGRLDLATRAAVPADPDRPIPIPRQAAYGLPREPSIDLPPGSGEPPDAVEPLGSGEPTGPVAALCRLATGHPGQPVALRIGATGHRTSVPGR